MRMNNFQNNSTLKKAKQRNWKLYKLTDVLVDKTRKVTKIKKGDYLESGNIPIIDQGASLIGGYSNFNDGYYDKVPFIVFGDHTRVLKYIEKPSFIGADGVKVLNLKLQDEINIKFLYYFLKSIDIPNTGYNRHFKYLKEVIIPIPTLTIQDEIVSLLDKINDIIAKRKQQIDALSSLKQSVFLDMFGDPVTNKMNWEKKSVIEYCDCIVPGRDKPKSFTGDIPWINTGDLKNLNVTNLSEKELGLSDEEINEVRAKVIPKNSVLITCVGDLGITSIAGTDMVVNQQLHSFQCKETINNIFLMYCLSYQKPYMYKYASQTTVPYMNKTVCNNIPVINPPLNLQNIFAKKVKEINQLEERLNSGLRLLNDNYDALIQKSFSGELFNS